MHIAFDGTTLRPSRTGVGCYAERLLRHLAAASPDDRFTVLSNRRVDVSASMPRNVRVHGGRRVAVSLAWLQMRAPAILRSIHADVAHFTNGVIPLASRVPSVVTIHDMSLTLFPQYHPVRRVLLHRPLVDLSAPRASAIITHSHAAKRDIERLYGIEAERVHVVHLAASPEFAPVRNHAVLDDVRRRYDLPERFILYVGTIEPRKNLSRLLAAFGARYRAGDVRLPLVCAGPYGWRARDVAEQVAALKLGPAIRFLGYLPFDDLPVLYNLADLFVFPSLYEGFGLPVVEAMACGTPVLIGRTGSLVEVGGDAVEVVDPLDTDAIGHAIASLAASEPRRRELRERGLARAATFSWERAAAETLSVYRQAMAQPVPARRARAAAAPANVTPAIQTSPIAAGGPVLFGQAYYLRFDPKVWAARQPYPPLGTLYAASYLREQGHRVALFDAMLAGSEKDWAAALDRHHPSVAVVYEDNFNYLSKMCLLRMRAAALEMIRLARGRGIPVVVSGSDASDHPEVYLGGGATCVVIGEGEVTVKETVEALGAGGATALHGVRGLCFRGAAGDLIRTPARDPIRDLDQLPRPAWDLVDIEQYRHVWRAHHGYHSMNIVTTRGCPYHCNWCAKPIYGQRYAVRRPEHVAAEMAWLKQHHAPDHLWIADDIFGLRPGWVEELARHLVALDAVIPFKCLMRADQVTPKVVTALQAARCQTVWIGAESGSQRILDAMEKGVRVAQIIEASALLRAAGIRVGLFLQFGYPGELRDDIDATIRMMRKCRPDDIGVSISYPLPGTRFYDRVHAELGQKQNWFDSDDLATMYHASYSPEFYRTLHQAVHAEFRLCRSAAQGMFGRKPWEVRPRHVRSTAAAMMSALRLPMLRWQLDQFSRGPVSPAVRPSRPEASV
jgi:anaerobic magnesium-protoporphyrin IX monomethyl ester cyclase